MKKLFLQGIELRKKAKSYYIKGKQNFLENDLQDEKEKRSSLLISANSWEQSYNYYQSAIEKFQMVLEMDPKNHPAIYYKSLCMFEIAKKLGSEQKELLKVF